MDTFCPSAVGWFEDVLGVGWLSVAFDSIFMSHRHVGRGTPGSQEIYPVHSQNSKYLAYLSPTLPKLLSSNKSCVSRAFSGSPLLNELWQLCCCGRPGVEAQISLRVSVLRIWPLSVVRAAGPQWDGVMRRLSTSE